MTQSAPSAPETGTGQDAAVSTPGGVAATPPLSAYIRTLNEERMIGAVVTAARRVAREVIIVDSGSVDRTCAIAEAAGARVIHQPWLGNGGQKRVGEEAASHDWVLDLDADEIVTDDLAAEIRALFAAPDGGSGVSPEEALREEALREEALREGGWREGGWREPSESVYRLTLVTAPPIGEPWPFALDPRAKLYDRRRWRIPDHRAWDQLELPKDAAVGSLSGALMHHSFRDFEHYMAKWNRVSSVRAKELKLKPLWLVTLRLLFARPIYFWRHYLLRGLWRGGLYGLAVARGVAFGRWMRDVKMYERHRGLHPPPTAKRPAAPQDASAASSDAGGSK